MLLSRTDVLRGRQQTTVSRHGPAPAEGFEDRPQRHLIAGEHRLAELLFQRIDEFEHAQVGATDENGLRVRSLDAPDQRDDLIERSRAYAGARAPEAGTGYDVKTTGDKEPTLAIGHVLRIGRRQ